jgi:toxin-antitoxin system PIN domain toxin
LNGSETVGLSWIVILAFLRLSTHATLFPEPISVDDGIALVRDWLAQDSAVTIDPTPRHLDVLGSLLAESGSFGNLVSDAHLAALAIEHNAVLISFDADFGRFKGLRWEQPPFES